VGDLLNSGLNPKTSLIAAYLAANVDVRVGTCWGSSRFSVLGSQQVLQYSVLRERKATQHDCVFHRQERNPIYRQ